METNPLQKLNRKELLELLLLQQKKIDELSTYLEEVNATLDYQQKFIDNFQVLADFEGRLSQLADRMESTISPYEDLCHGL